jgi:hypothetical protein
MCDELYAEYTKFQSLLNIEENIYLKDAPVFHITSNNKDPDFYKWKQTDKATYYRKYEDIYTVTKIGGYYSHPYRFAKLPVEKEIRIFGLHELNKRCHNEGNIELNK